MKILVLGGVAAGTKTAAKLLREDRSNDVLILNKGENISYAGCGLPYYIGHVIDSKEELIVNTPEKFEKLTGAKVLTRTEAIKVDRSAKKVTAVDLQTGKESVFDYDKLVIATGASAAAPPIPGIDLENVFFMRTPEDAVALRETLDSGTVKRAVIVGAGYIGLEIAENLAASAVKPFVLDMAEHALPGFDAEMSAYIEKKLLENGIAIVTGAKVNALEGAGKVEKVITDKRAFKTDAVILSAGIKPNTAFLEGSGIEMFKGTILTNAKGQTNDPDIYAAGDCAMVRNAITGKPMWSPMGSTANINGRLIAQDIAGANLEYRGALGTAVCKLPGTNAGKTGLSEAQAKEEGFDPVSVVAVIDDKPGYMPGASSFIIKMIADRKTQRLLGVQAIGQGGIDAVIDIAVAAITCKATLPDIADMDLAYAPPFSTAIHPFEHTLNILLNKINGSLESITPAEYADGAASEYKIVDAGAKPSIEGAERVDLAAVDGPVEGLGAEEKLLLVCAKGKRAYLLQNRLKFYGYKNTKTLEGGTFFNDVKL